MVKDATSVKVILHDKRIFKADWVRSDPATDLAVIKIHPARLSEIPFGDSDKMQVGDWVLAFGSPRGLSESVSAGIISAKGRPTRKPGFYADYIQTDAAINAGNSGGPLVNMYGEIIGINNSIVTKSGGNEGIGFSIPANMAQKIIAQLITQGKVQRGYFGIRTQNIDEELAESFGLKSTRGALVVAVTKSSPAAKGGLKTGDVIAKVGNDLIDNSNDVLNVCQMFKPNQIAPILVYREGKTLTLKITVGSRSGGMPTVHP